MPAFEILLIEDNDYDAELTLRALKEYHLSHPIIRFADGQKALDYLFQLEITDGAKKRCDLKLILLDLKLIGKSGKEVLTAIRSNLYTALIPVVVLTSSTLEQDIQSCYKLGANSFISKPVEFDAFVAVMKGLGLYWLTLNKTP